VGGGGGWVWGCGGVCGVGVVCSPEPLSELSVREPSLSFSLNRSNLLAEDGNYGFAG